MAAMRPCASSRSCLSTSLASSASSATRPWPCNAWGQVPREQWMRHAAICWPLTAGNRMESWWCRADMQAAITRRPYRPCWPEFKAVWNSWPMLAWPRPPLCIRPPTLPACLFLRTSLIRCWGKLPEQARKRNRIMSKQEAYAVVGMAGHEGVDATGPFPLHFHWLVDDLHICAGPPAHGQLWCLNVDVWRPSTGEGERMLWDANTPWGLVRRDSRSATIMSVEPGPRERDLLVVADQGIGDIVQQLRYVPPVAAHFCRTRIQCGAELHRFIRRQALNVEPVSPEQVAADPPKVRVPLMRMGALCADPDKGAAYLTAQRRPGAARRGFRVGLNWSASKRGVAKDI